jgi:hypothetical protein
LTRGGHTSMQQRRIKEPRIFANKHSPIGSMLLIDPKFGTPQSLVSARVPPTF